MHRIPFASVALIAVHFQLVACAATTSGGPRRDGGTVDAASPSDATVTDSGMADGAASDARTPDGGLADMTVADTGPVDLGASDLGSPDLGLPDLGPPDLGPPDLGPPDLGPADLGPADLGAPDLGLCAAVYADPVAAADMDLWDCGVSGQLGGCRVNDSRSCGSCACDSYVTAASICTGGSCSAPISGTGCSDHSYYSGAPFLCSGTMFPQTACMLRYLLLNGYCD